MKSRALTDINRKIVLLCGLALIVVLFVPLWQIELAAPQYPEGLVLKMYPHKLAGNVDIINGLNHYIGMKTLHTEDFLEFTVLPYIITFFAVFSLAVAIFLRTAKWLSVLFTLFVIFGIVAMADFWRWEYQYGHDLDPNAAINVPGMSYQPPLIGYKQLLNFGAYSIPDIGGWIFIGVGIGLLTAIILQYRHQKNTVVMKWKTAPLFLSLVLLMASCSVEPKPIKIGKDACFFCKMGVMDKRFGAELISKKGKIYKFDDLHCLMEFSKEATVKNVDIQGMYLVDYENPHGFIDLQKAFLFKSEALRSPMGSNIAAFLTEEQLKATTQSIEGRVVQLNSLMPTLK
ncbi:nitrous oxide reductase accessory protein NosL [Pedobacter nyackensis]|uniref:Copper chaperone NosL n=1 Tax=Pedobacter nyackensis TaxID=475255 RepID=A0A1W2DVU9_9SPHI|nr:nitrous oxide reductase accessory protein NosL [Pedobacter nyackensis]SMD01580.1 copper chaperone NosL [Pedobacter nyackensis]